ncbi:sulfatase-like hydrolase/transferase [Dyadobacter sp. CY327]|uniref:sulfatase-like hydrolase/transferase n=1 Tax=Dyadobacter sp. CY327 TaxID=2907301 RepID=UPI001F203BEB|nr:sulfatase-like hydrolase/transferase [Dyadobacter sp. CY327]MCE7072210.1 sulfatase-like hydrolase/transferase [Dyadobacter sp. CY327]
MKGINLLKVVAAPLWLIFQCLPVLAQPQHAEKGKSRPNVIIILTDDMGVGDIGAFGGSMVPTPYIDKLAV